MAVKYGKKVKELMIKEVENLFKKEKGLVFSRFNSVKANEMNAFRKKVRRMGAKHFLVKKRIGKKAIEKMGLKDLTAVFDAKDHVGVTIIKDDPVAIAKLVVDFAKDNKNFVVTNGYIDGQLVGAEKVKQLASLPGRQQLLAILAGTLNAPIAGFVGVLAAHLRSLPYVLVAIKGQKEKGSK